MTFVLLCGASFATEGKLMPWYGEPAQRWEDDLPVGNGRLGNMVFGGTKAERIHLNEETIWAGPPVPQPHDGIRRAMAEGRTAWFAADFGTAHKVLQAALPAVTNLSECHERFKRPAGKHGRIARPDKDPIYNGKAIKLWGLNLCYGACAPERELVDRRAAFYRKHGASLGKCCVAMCGSPKWWRPATVIQLRCLRVTVHRFKIARARF